MIKWHFGSPSNKSTLPESYPSPRNPPIQSSYSCEMLLPPSSDSLCFLVFCPYCSSSPHDIKPGLLQWAPPRTSVSSFSLPLIILHIATRLKAWFFPNVPLSTCSSLAWKSASHCLLSEVQVHSLAIEVLQVSPHLSNLLSPRCSKHQPDGSIHCVSPANLCLS